MLRKPFMSLLIGTVITAYSIALPAADAENEAPSTGPVVPDNLIYTVGAKQTPNAAILGGAVMPVKMVNLIAQMPGEVKYIAGEEGDAFETGTILVGLDTAALMEKRRAAVAGYNSANAGLANAQVQYRRELLNPNTQANSMLGGAPSMFSMFSDPFREFSGEGDPDYERYSNIYGQNVQIQTARDQIEQALAGISELDENIRNTQSVAPYQGVIVKKMIEVGDVVQPGMPLLVFADTSVMQIQVEVPARLISNLSADSVVSAKLDGSNHLMPARVARIFPMASEGGHTTTVKLNLPSNSGARPGMYAEILIPTGGGNTQPLATVPESAISWRGSLPAVFAVSPDKTSLKMRTLRLGRTDSNGMVSVLSGVSIGDKILKKPLSSTRSGPYTLPVQ